MLGLGKSGQDENKNDESKHEKSQYKTAHAASCGTGQCRSATDKWQGAAGICDLVIGDL
jgi:hypothetical protein